VRPLRRRENGLQEFRDLVHAIRDFSVGFRPKNEVEISRAYGTRIVFEFVAHAHVCDSKVMSRPARFRAEKTGERRYR